MILSSHVLSEVESVCSRIGLINNGRVSKEGTLSELRTSRVHKVSALIEGQLPAKSELEISGVRAIEIDKNLVRFEVQGSVDQVLKILSKYQVVEFDSRELSLEEVFFSEVEN